MAFETFPGLSTLSLTLLWRFMCSAALKINFGQFSISAKIACNFPPKTSARAKRIPIVPFQIRAEEKFIR